MKQKKRSGFSRISALLLVIVLAVNLVVPCFAAGGVVFDDTKTIDTGILTYDYDKIPENMLEDNYALDALEYIGYDVQALKDNKVLYHQDYIGSHLAGSQYLLQEDPILTYIRYNDSGAPGGSSKKAETVEEIAASKTGRVPNIEVFKNGNDTYKSGMSCTSFVEYYVFGYLKHIVGKDTSYIETMHATALQRLADGTRTYPDTWTEMCEGKGGLISQGKVTHFSIKLEASKDQTDEYNEIWREISPGTIIRFGNDNSDYLHYAVYIGTYNNLHYVAHVAGGDRGPEIFIAEHMAYRNDSKTSYPIDFYDFHFQDPYGAIQVVKTDADDGAKLSGAMFLAVNADSGKAYPIGPTNEKGYAIREELPYGTYTVRETVPPEGYSLSSKTWTVVLKSGASLATLEQEIVNEKSFGSLQILKDTNTGNNKAGWQFNVYKNSPVYTTALSLDNSGQMFRVTVSDSNGYSVTSDAVSMTTTPLKILRQPSNVAAAVGEKVSYTVIAQGDGISYQWQYKNPGDEWTTSSSTDGHTPYYSYTMRADRDGRLSRCIITDKYGNTVTTDEVFMVLPTTLAVLTDPEDTTTAVGQTVTMAITASGSNVSYQWQYSTNGGTTWTNCTTSNHSGCTGATSNTLKFTGNAAYDGRIYRCKITDGSTTKYSEAATSNIVASIINTQPQTQIAELGDSVTFSISATGTSLTYTWQGKARGSSTWTTLGSGSSYTTTLTEDNEGMEVRCVIGSGGLTTVSDSAYLATADTLLITSQPQNHVDETGTYAKFEVEAQGNGLTYVWETSTDGGNTWTTLTTPINDTPYVTDANGKYLIAKLQTGNYFVQEINDGKDGWEYDLIAKPVTVTADHTATAPANVNFTNNEITGGLLIVKTTEDKKNLVGWQFGIYSDAACENLIVTDTTRAGGRLTVTDIVPGTYWVKELGHSSGAIDDLYYCAGENPQMIVVEAGKTASVKFENKLRKGDGQIIKLTTNGGIKAGWQFHVWTDTKDLGIYTTDINGEINDLSQLLPGTYYVQETGHATLTDAELAYWTLDAEVKELVIEADQIKSVTFNNQWYGQGGIVKESPGIKEGWQFQVWTDTKDLGIYTTDINGDINLGLMEPGTVYVQEIGHATMTPEELSLWFMDTSVKELVIEAGQTRSIVIQNVPGGGFDFEKIMDDGSSAEGWRFDIQDSEGNVTTHYTDENGKINLVLLPGTYTVTEVIPADKMYEPMGGSLSFEIEIVAGEILVKTFINVPIQGDITISKTDGKGKPVSNAGFVATGSDGKKYNFIESTTTPGLYELTNIPIDDYIITEDVVPPGFQISGDNEWKVSLSKDHRTETLDIVNIELGKGKIIKEMADGTSPVGHKFQVIGPDGVELEGSPFEITREDGVFSIDDLVPGEYKVIELLPENSIYAPVGGVEQALTVVAGETASVTFVNALRSGEISGIKVDSSSGAALAGAKFILEWLDNDIWVPVVYSDTVIPGGCSTLGLEDGCLTTGEDGLFSFAGLHPDCQYRLREVQAPNGYLLQAASVFEGQLPTDTLSVFREVPNTHTFTYPASGSSEISNMALATGCLMLLAMLMAAVVLPSNIRKFRIQRTQR